MDQCQQAISLRLEVRGHQNFPDDNHMSFMGSILDLSTERLTLPVDLGISPLTFSDTNGLLRTKTHPLPFFLKLEDYSFGYVFSLVFSLAFTPFYF